MEVEFMKNIVETGIEMGKFNKLMGAIEAAGLVDTLSNDGPFTVFAPNDYAFAKLPEGAAEELLNDKEKLNAVLTYHVLSGSYKAEDFKDMKSVKTLQGGELKINTRKGFRVGKANVIKLDIMCTNGVCHMIDAVLMPE
jgi:uncharacterized surface protein with fasciclin (FAS1) repeats